MRTRRSLRAEVNDGVFVIASGMTRSASRNVQAFDFLFVNLRVPDCRSMRSQCEPQPNSVSAEECDCSEPAIRADDGFIERVVHSGDLGEEASPTVPVKRIPKPVRAVLTVEFMLSRVSRVQL